MRYGGRRVVLTSLVLFAITFMGFALSNGSLPLYYATWAMAALVGAGTLPMTWTVAVNQRFEQRVQLTSLIGLSALSGRLVEGGCWTDFGRRWSPWSCWACQASPATCSPRLRCRPQASPCRSA